MFFQQLGNLAQRAGGSVTIFVKQAQGDDSMTVVVTPKNSNKDEPALATPLVLNATPAEFDAEFMAVLVKYDASHRSLSEQVETTKEVLAAAAEAQAKKGTSAAARASEKVTRSKAIQAAAAPRETGDDPDDDPDVTDDTGEKSSNASTPVATPNAVPTVPNLFGDTP